MAERNGKKWQRHCRATVAHNDAPCVHKCDLQKKANGWPSISSEELYKKLSDFFQLHRTFQGIRKLFHQAGQTEVICEISLDEGERRRAQSFNIHPALLDSIIQSGLGLICVSGGDFRGVPFHLGKFRLMKRRENFPCDLRTWCQGRSVDNGFYLNVQAFDMNGEIVCSVQDLFFKNIWALVPSPTVKLDLEWRKLWGDDLEAVSMNVDKQHWLVIWPGQEEFSELTLFEGIKQVVRATLVREFPLESAALKGITHTAVIAESQMTQAGWALMEDEHDSSSELVLRFEKDGAQLFGASLRETPWEATSPLICLETAPLEHTLDLKPGLSFSVQQQSGVYVLTWSGGETFPLPFDIDPHSVLRRLKDWLVPALLRQFDMEGQLVLLQGIVGDLEINRLDKFCQKMKCTRILLIHNELDSSPQSCGKVLMVSPTDILEHVVKFDNDTGFINLAGSDEVFAQIGSLCSGHVTNLNSLSLRAICKLLPESIRLILQEDLMMRSFDAQQTTPLPGASVQVRSDGTYVVAGGTRGLGLQLARPEDLPDMLLFEECDITDADLVREVLSKVPSPVCGLISVATEYHDKPLVEVKCAEDLSRAIKAKTLCSLHLHQASQNLNLDRNIDFLAISSIATLFGSHSQAGYVMANGYVQGLMQHRRAKGLRGCYMNVGVVSDVGFAADHPQIIRDWQRRGIAPVSSDKVCLAIGRLLMSGRNSLAFSCKADTRSYFQAFPHLVLNMEKRGNLSRLRGLMTREEFQDLRNLLEDAGDLRQRLGIMSAEDKEEFVKEQVAKVVKSKLDINDFSEGDPLEDLGLTSQTASMIRQDLNAKFRVNLEQMLVLTAGVPEIASGILSHLESQSEGNRWWQLIGNQVTNPSSLLLCMPPNASGTSVYKSWLQHTTVPVVCGTPPGWADRLEEGCVENWSDLIQTFFNELQHFLQHHGWGEVPLVLYGHSFGALIVAALAERLERECKEVQHLGIGAWCAPQKSYRERYPEHMKVDFEKLKDPKVDLLFAKEELRHFEFLPEEFFTHSDGAILQTARCVAASLKMSLSMK
ncbi:Phenolphthiocerol synthesis polyketide synthase type I Pks15/1 (Beta-ketoacyl-acyl-carrier-protein synthase I) [Durusdinium trenchii]|uniref:Phenolphthiocerol synthesis polyketide synthase type I Pks15/1 (Beta-ketoacyl-acyl-carrier-protein synthase I) n=1 Tax=Durusdinium trenchii TaxID=1381693 RepID=A0ABP0SPI7_9DINO